MELLFRREKDLKSAEDKIMISCCNKHFKEKKEGTERTVGQGEIGK